MNRRLLELALKQSAPLAKLLDERLQFLLQSSESNNEQIGKLTENVQALTEASERHEREQERLRAAMLAAFQACLSGGNGEEKT